MKKVSQHTVNSVRPTTSFLKTLSGDSTFANGHFISKNVVGFKTLGSDRKSWLLVGLLLLCCQVLKAQQTSVTVQVSEGSLLGLKEDNVAVFKGVPYAQPPIGNLRWKEPQPVKRWTGTRKANRFRSRAMQRFIYKDMRFRSEDVNEDCLYLNIWTSNVSAKEKMPVLVYFHGGGLSAGDGSEWRYDGKSMAQKGIVAITVNYRLGIFGFLVHPELRNESAHRASGNYGFLDQRAALLWVKQNIARFGGDPAKVTIAGQSAGSISVSAHMASPLSKGLFRSAIGQSGSILASLSAAPLKEAEERGRTFAAAVGAATVADLRKLSAEQLLELAAKEGMPHFGPVVDGYFLPQSPMTIYATGLQADVPLLAGWTSAEVSAAYLLGKEEATSDNFKRKVQELYGLQGADILSFYPAGDKDVLQSATDLASDRFIAYGTWKWIDLHGKTSGSTVYRYLFNQPLPQDSASGGRQYLSLGAPHSADIEYALGNLASNTRYRWTTADDSVSSQMQQYFVNFVKTGNPNGEGLPDWPGLQSSIPKVMIFGNRSRAEGEKNLKRYVFLDRFYYQ